MYSNKKVSKQSFQRRGQKRRLTVVIIVLGLILVACLWQFGFHKKHAISGPITAQTQTTTPATSNQTSSTDSGFSSSQTATPSTSDKTVGGGSSTTLATGSVLPGPPTGTFVSNHRPSLSGTTTPSKEQSACTTVPGATCYIKFTKDGVVKTLPVQTADNNGSVIWNWDVAQAGFDTGSWQITAIASLNGQSKSATDSLALEVKP